MSESPYGLIWPRGTRPFGTLGAVRQHPTLGVVNEARVVDDDGRDLGPGETGELLLRNPAVTPGYWGMPEETAAGDRRRLAAHRRPGHGGRRRHLHVRRPAQGGAAPARREPLAARGRGGARGAPGRAGVRRGRRAVGAVRGRGQGVRRAGRRRRSSTSAQLRDSRRPRLSAFKVPRYWQQLDELPRTPTARVAKHQLPTGHPPGEYDAEAHRHPQASLRPGPGRAERTSVNEYPTSIGTADATRSRCSATTWPPS